MAQLYNMHDVIQADVEKLLMRLYTTIPAKVISYNATKQTVNVTVAVNTPTYSGNNIPAAKYTNIPVMFPAGGKWVIAGPIEAGDVVLLVAPHYGTREYTTGDKDGTGDSKFVHRHDLNDAIALPGMFTSNSTTNKPTREDELYLTYGEDASVRLSDDLVEVSFGGTKFTVDASGITVTGNLTVNGTIQGTIVKTPTVGLATHVHNYIDNPSATVVATAVGVG